MDGAAAWGESERREWLGRVAAAPEARAIVRAWRRITGGRGVRDAGRRTLAACSGGADSMALALALAASAGEHLVIGHVRHDIRAAEVASADARAVEDLAGRLGVEFVRGQVRVAGLAGNLEGNARRARYAALVELARAHGCEFVATGHQGDDQLETMVMRLVRGAGPRGLAGMAERRRLAEGVELVRPMLGMTREGSERLCRAAGVEWREDATNLDVRAWRARVRMEVVPVLRGMRADVHARAAATARLLRDAAGAMEREGRELFERGVREGDGLVWRREDVEGVSVGVLGETLRMARGEIVGSEGADRFGERDVRMVWEGIADADRRGREWVVAGVGIWVTREELKIGRAGR